MSQTKLVQLPAHIEAWGFIPHMISPHADEPMWEQIHLNYGYGGGWNDFIGFDVTVNSDDLYQMQYPGDPPYIERDRFVIDDETLVLFDHSWLLWVKGDEHRVARVD